MLESYVGVVCSKAKGEVYCLEGSNEHKTRFNERDDFDFKGKLDIIYIHHSYLTGLIQKQPDVSEWDINDVLGLESKMYAN